MLKTLLIYVIISPLYYVLYYLIGRLLFKIGYKKIGHKLVAMSIAEDFGKCRKVRKWLYVNCPYNFHCEKCKIWNCKNTKIRNWFNDVMIVTNYEFLNSEESHAEREQN